MRKTLVYLLLLVIGSVSIYSAHAQQKAPLPRMVSLRSDEVNVRTGPGVQYPIKWIFKMKNMPVEIIAEYDTWRKIRDSEGEEGWIHRAMLVGGRSLVITEPVATLREEPDIHAAPVARLALGLVAEISECNSSWCHVSVDGYDGWILRSKVWGVYPHEVLN